MGVRSAGDVIREARVRAKISQEALSDGICSYVTLCNIEKGSYGVSPLTFELLMERTGAYNQIYPIFENLNDYLCFWHLNHARFYLTRRKLSEAEKELNGLQDKNFNSNKFYYQEWALLTAWLEVKKGNTNYTGICDFLYQALLISKSKINLFDLTKITLSSVEIKIILLYATELLVLGEKNDSFIIYNQLKAYLENSRYTDKERKDLYVKIELINILTSIFSLEFDKALDQIESNINLSQQSANEKYLFELNYMKAVCLYKLGLFEEFDKTMSMLKVCEKAIDVDYLPFATSFFGSFDIKGFDIVNENPIKLTFIPHSEYKDGTFNIYGKDVMTLGSIIKYHREQQKLSAKVLCQGLCGVALLSKIENNLINPDILIACAILNRLGISDEVFTFFGNKEEALFYDLKTKLEYGPHFNRENFSKTLLELNNLAQKTNKVIIKQTALYFTVNHQTLDRNDLFSKLKEVLEMTIKNFDINNLSKYRLSKIEFNIINLMMDCYSKTNNPSIARNYYLQISNYLKTCNIDIMHKIQLAPTTAIMYFSFLDTYKLFTNASFEMNVEDYTFLSYTLKGMGYVYFYYAIALCELNDLEKAKTIAQISFYELIMTGHKTDAFNLKEGLYNDYHLSIY